MLLRKILSLPLQRHSFRSVTYVTSAAFRQSLILRRTDTFRSLRRCSNFRRTALDSYAVLGLEPGSSMQEITSAYRALALRWHPDRNPGDAHAEERFKDVAAAYQTLRDVNSSSRSTIDRASEDFASSAGFTREEAEQIFKSVFGADTLSEIASAIERAEALQKKNVQEVLERFPGAEKAMQQLVIGNSGSIVMRTTVVRDGRSEIHEREVSPEEMAELAEVGAGVARAVGKASVDVATTVAAEVGHGVAHGLFSLASGGAQRLHDLTAPLVPQLPLPFGLPSLAPPRPKESSEDKKPPGKDT
eukprot:TRINITY_DN58629_c0_g1_i1.p1 TRINITY_DN58629_c0_g1~~TRINITY_DN58629_c0_g1_i1.p1  ORF type:complete len:303 (+),score=66.64 TRINITY_DN58629_c0_g1_i1:73-981(+)